MSDISTVIVRQYSTKDLEEMLQIWNSVVEDGNAFPQDTVLSKSEGERFFLQQSYCGVALDGTQKVQGLYILHPNNVGRCSHIANASFAVAKASRGQNIGRLLVKDCIKHAHDLHYKILQFNAVVCTNVAARSLYESLGFKPLGIIPNGFRLYDNSYVDICPYYIEL